MPLPLSALFPWDQVRDELRQRGSRGLSGEVPPGPSRWSAARTRTAGCRQSCARSSARVRRCRWGDCAGWPALRPHPSVALGNHPPGTLHRDVNSRSRAGAFGATSRARVHLRHLRASRKPRPRPKATGPPSERSGPRLASPASRTSAIILPGCLNRGSFNNSLTLKPTDAKRKATSRDELPVFLEPEHGQSGTSTSQKPKRTTYQRCIVTVNATRNPGVAT